MNDTTITVNQEKQLLSDALCDVIVKRIQQSGPMPFDQYMQLALYHPTYGYYRNGLAKFGKEGDFVTAPEISPLYGYCLANQCQQIMSHSGITSLLEFGAGSGQLASDILSRLKSNHALPERYLILEPSSDLQQRQQRLLQQSHPNYFANIQWLNTLPKHPLDAIIIANEVLDAMPVSKFIITNDSIEELAVTHLKHQLAFTSVKAKPELAQAVNHLKLDRDTRYESEINLWLPGWIKSLDRCLNTGVVLLVDYGFPRHEYYHPERNTGTIMCHINHRAHSNPLVLPGVQDITSHVDFTAIAEYATAHQFEVAGYTHQAAFLCDCGLLEFTAPPDEVERYHQAQQIKTLTLASEMGELFKVMALSKQVDLDLMGFKSLNLSYRL